MQDVHGGEAWDLITFVHSDGLLDSHVRVLLCRVECLELGVKSIELHLDARTGRQLVCLGATWSSLDALLCVEFTGNLVLVACHKLSDHSPDHVQLLALRLGHWLTKIVKLTLSFLQFLTDLVHDLRQVVTNVGKQYAGQFCCQDFTTEVTWGHGGVNWMRIEETHFLLHGCFHGNLSLDVFLGSVLDADKSETELDFLVHDRTLGVGTAVHDINFGDDTDSSDTLGVDAASHS